LRALLRAAIGGLNAREREIIELQLWQGLDTAESAAALGISGNHAHALLSRARDQLAVSIGVLLVARTGREDCSVLDGLLGEWDGQLTPLLRKRLSRHVERCDSCSDRRRGELRPELLTLWPAGALATAAAAEQARHAAGLPAGLKERVLKTAAGKDAGAAASRAGLGSKAGTFGKSGFPRPRTAHRPWPPGGKGARVFVRWGLAGAAAAVIAIAVFGGTHAIFLGPPGGGTGSAPGPSVSPSGGAAPSVSPGGQPAPGRGRRTGTGGAGGPTPVPVVTLTPVATSSPGVSPTSAVPTTSPSGQPSSSPSPSSSASPQPSSQPSSSSSSAAPPPAPGTLAVSPTAVTLTPLLGSSITLTAQNGPVSWSISEPASLVGELVVSPASGTLAAGQSTQVTISVSGLASLDTTLTVNPGGQRVTVLLGVGLLGRSG
jgi:DNA-binding CsgD family transcriptional regulator